ncbi:MAG TPA: TauD/TfdA family dioxygenase [Burkholderiaceae bacterium]|nr:TauD/TfdA family dioxygenase [Burkholderiaceae bacterium]
MDARPFEVHRIAGALGAEVRGLDLRRIDAPTAAAVRAAWLEHQVLFFVDQDLDEAAFMAVARAMGEPVEYPFVRGMPGWPEIIEVKKLEHERTNFGGVWHTDTSYLPSPPSATLLLARELPPWGGDTEFASGYAAWDALSEGLRRTLAPLRAVASSSKADVSRTREDRIRSDGRDDARPSYEAEHPVARVHPETGRVALYVNVAHTVRFAGWTEAESAPLLGWLFEHQRRAEHTCRWRWRPGSLALWDNRCVLHNPVNDYHGHRRVMHRITLAGDVPR